jgi:hypothetical protein
MALQSTTAISTITLQSASSSVTFSGIPNTYRDLILVVNGNVTGSLTTRLRFNTDAGSNYFYVSAAGDNANGAYSTSATNTGIIPLPDFADNAAFQHVYQIIDYSQTNKHKSVMVRAGVSGTSPNMVAGRWSSTVAINALSISASANAYTAGSTFSLYGRIA